MDERRREHDLGWFLFGVIVVFVGGYYLLTNTFGINLPELNWDMVWPLIVIAVGVGILWRAISGTEIPRPH